MQLTVACICFCLIAITKVQAARCPKDLAKFVDPLPIPRVLVPREGLYDNYPLYTINITQTAQKLHRDLPPTQMWVYDGTFPGPTIETESYQKIHVNIINNLPIDAPLLPQSDLGMTHPQDRIVVHLHGGLSKPQYCGHPLDFVRPLPGKNSYTNYYGNQQPATFLWYHDHTMQITAANVYAGLVGAYFIRDEFERALGLPQGEFEIPLILCDKNIDPISGKLIYEFDRNFTGGHYNLVNGKVWPYHNVQPTRYRFRILNASNHRMYNLYFDNRMEFYVIGGDQGFLMETVPVREIFLTPAERIDIIVDFSEHSSQNMVLKTSASFIYPVGPSVSDCDTAIMMQFRVGDEIPIVYGNLPEMLLGPDFEMAEDTPEVRHRTFYFEALNVGHGLQFLINGDPFMSRLAASVPVGSMEVWEFVNYMRAAHPVHIHAVEFRVLDRRPFNKTYFGETHQVQFTGPAVPAHPYEYGYKDTFVIGAYETARVLINFRPYTGEFIFHCHLLEHEDNDMMRRFAITPVGPDCEWDEFQKDEDCTYFQ